MIVNYNLLISGCEFNELFCKKRMNTIKKAFAFTS
jgi:hypothetical protein